MADYKGNEQNIKDNEREERLNSTEFILDFKKVGLLAGVGVFAYLVGKRDGFDFGYVKGYERCMDNITDIVKNTNKLR